MGLNQKANDPQAKVRRKQGGLIIKTLRTSAGYTQRELAQKVGLEYYTFISQIESGTGRVPPQHYAVWAEALGVDVKKFVRELLKFYDPLTFEVIYDANCNEETDYENLRL